MSNQAKELAWLTRSLPNGVAHAVHVTLAESISRADHARGERVLELAERFPEYGAELRALALRVGFDPELKARALLSHVS